MTIRIQAEVSSSPMQTKEAEKEQTALFSGHFYYWKTVGKTQSLIEFYQETTNFFFFFLIGIHPMQC